MVDEDFVGLAAAGDVVVDHREADKVLLICVPFERPHLSRKRAAPLLFR